jgi:hypothetical protein
MDHGPVELAFVGRMTGSSVSIDLEVATRNLPVDHSEIRQGGWLR